MIKTARVYSSGGESGYRILVDRLWPRGVSKEDANLDLWLKEIGPSNELRKWFGHDPEYPRILCAVLIRALSFTIRLGTS